MGLIMKNAVIAGVIAGIVNLILFFIGNALFGGITEIETPGADPVQMSFIKPFLLSVIPALFAGLGLWVAQKWIPNGTRIWQIGTIAIALLTIGGPLNQSLIPNPAAGIILAIMHVVLGVVYVWYMTLRKA